MRVIVRGWGDGGLIFEEALELEKPEDYKLEDMIRHADEHVDLIAKFDEPLLEIELQGVDLLPLKSIRLRVEVDDSGVKYRLSAI
jgi:hypothetical protein